MSKYIIIETTRYLAIPAEHGDLLGKIKTVDQDYESGKGYVYTWDDKSKPSLTLINASEIRQPKPEPEPELKETKPEDLEPL